MHAAKKITTHVLQQKKTRAKLALSCLDYFVMIVWNMLENAVQYQTCQKQNYRRICLSGACQRRAPRHQTAAAC